MSSLTTIYDLLQAGGPVAMSALLFFMWWVERRRGMAAEEKYQKQQQVLQDRVLALVTAQTESAVKLETSIAGIQALVTQMLQQRR